jgi:hypothetical protein
MINIALYAQIRREREKRGWPVATINKLAKWFFKQPGVYLWQFTHLTKLENTQWKSTKKSTPSLMA